MKTPPNPTYIRKIMLYTFLLFAAGSIFSIAVTQTALGVTMALWAAAMIAARRWEPRRTPLDYYFVALAAAGLISLAASGSSAAAINFAKRVLLIPIVYLTAFVASDPKFLKRILAVMISVMAILALFGIFKYLEGIGGLQGRLRLFHHYMTTGGILMILSLMTFGIVLARPPRRYMISAASAGAVMLVPLVFTFTRSSWLGFIAGITVMSVFQNKKMILVIAAVLTAFLLLAPDSMTDRARSAFNPHHPMNVERVHMWKAGIRMIKAHPLTGVGDVDLMSIYGEYKDPDAKEPAGHLHNNVIMFGAIMGVPGMLAFIALSIRIFLMEIGTLLRVRRGDWLARGTALGAAGVFIGFQVSGLFEWNFGDAEICMLMWLTVGLALAVRSRSMERSG